MGNLVIVTKDGETLQARATITKAEQTRQLLGEDVVKIEIASTEPIHFEIGDRIEITGKTYTLNQLPVIRKINSREFTHALTFEGEQYELMDSAYLLPGDTYGDAFTGNLEDFLDIIIMNATRGNRPWRLGTFPGETEYKTLAYPQSNCLQVLQNVCTEYNLEFEIVREGETRVLNITEKAGGEFLTPFYYGRTGGAYSIERRTASNRNVTTKLFVFGSDRNLPGAYRENKLCLPGKSRNESFITEPSAVLLYGTRESVRQFPDIYPARYGRVSAVNPSAVTEFFDESMDFDLNERKDNGDTKWLIPGTTAKIQFNSGGLAGYSFEILSYNHEQKKFRLKTYTDPNGLRFPNEQSEAFRIKENDEYFITDIHVPDSYIADAERRLEEKATRWFDENCRPEVLYNIDLDHFFLQKIYGNEKTESEIFRPGMAITINDQDLDISKSLRITAFTRDLLNPYKFKITTGEKVQVQTFGERIFTDISEIKETLRENNMTDAARARRNWRTTEDVINAVFDPDGYFSDKIRPMSIETRLLAVGARSQQYILKDCEISANYGANPNAIHNTAGILEHYTIAEPDVRQWQIQEGTTDSMDEDKTYYIYAKCDREGQNGIILYTPTQIATESDPRFYHFLIGTTTTVITDSDGKRPARNIALSYGNTTINGRFINTGRIESADGRTYFDLDKGEIGGTVNFTEGLISRKIWIGDSLDAAIGGIGGDKWMGRTILLWANKIEHEGQEPYYCTSITDDGTIRVMAENGGEVCNFNPYGDGLARIENLNGANAQITRALFGNKTTTIDTKGIETSKRVKISNSRLEDADGFSYMGRYAYSKEYTDSDGDRHFIEVTRCGNIVSIFGRISKKDIQGTAPYALFPIRYGYYPQTGAILAAQHNTGIDDTRSLRLDADGRVAESNIGDYTYIAGTYMAAATYHGSPNIPREEQFSA